MTVKFTPASITIEVPTDAVTLDAETVSALLDGSASRTTLARVRALLTPRTVTITEGTRVRLKANPEDHPDFEFGMRGWDNDDMTVDSVTGMEVQVSTELSRDYTRYTGPFEKILDVLEVLEDKSPETRPGPAADAEGWVEWDFSNDAGPNLPKGALVEVKFRDGSPQTSGSEAQPAYNWNWRDDGVSSDIVAYRIV